MSTKSKLRALLWIAALGLSLCCVPWTASAQEPGVPVKITAKKFEYNPSEITVKKGVPVVLEFTALDRLHGFSCPDLGLRADLVPGKPVTVKFTPEKAGSFPFHCDIFCGDGHEDMAGTIVVTD